MTILYTIVRSYSTIFHLSKDIPFCVYTTYFTLPYFQRDCLLLERNALFLRVRVITFATILTHI